MALWSKYHANGEEIKNGWVCDSCDGWSSRISNYCPHCGERMKDRIAIPKWSNVKDFVNASDWTDWINQTTESVYIIYWQWCVKNEFIPVTKVNFMRQVLAQVQELKSSPCRGKRYFRLVQ